MEDVYETLLYMEKCDEMFQIMNGRSPITWSIEDDGTGKPIGLRDKCDTTQGFTLRYFSKKYGVSLKYLQHISGLTSPDSKPEPGSMLLIDRLQRLISVVDYFREWKQDIDVMSISKKAKAAMFITPTTYSALRKMCYGTVGLIKKYVTNSDRCWVLRRLNQDPLESTYGQLRNISGSNTDMNVRDIRSGMSEIRALGLNKVKRT